MSTVKRTRIENGNALPAKVEDLNYQVQSIELLPPNTLQYVMSYLFVADLLSFDTAIISHRNIIMDAYNYNTGLNSVALNMFHYTKRSQLNWLLNRCIDMNNFFFDMPQNQRSDITNKGSNGTRLWQSSNQIKVWPALQYLVCYQGPQSCSIDRNLSLMIASRATKSCIEEKCSNGWSSLHLACDIGDIELVTALLSNGADASSRSNSGQTPLSRAIYWGSLPCMRLLLAYGSDTTIIENDGSTLLHRCVTKAGVGASIEHRGEALKEIDKLEFVQFLLEHGTKPNIQDMKGRTAIDESEKLGYEKITKLLRSETTYEKAVDREVAEALAFLALA